MGLCAFLYCRKSGTSACKDATNSSDDDSGLAYEKQRPEIPHTAADHSYDTRKHGSGESFSSMIGSLQHDYFLIELFICWQYSFSFVPRFRYVPAGRLYRFAIRVNILDPDTGHLVQSSLTCITGLLPHLVTCITGQLTCCH